MDITEREGNFRVVSEQDHAHEKGLVQVLISYIEGKSPTPPFYELRYVSAQLPVLSAQCSAPSAQWRSASKVGGPIYRTNNTCLLFS